MHLNFFVDFKYEKQKQDSNVLYLGLITSRVLARILNLGAQNWQL